MISRTRIRFMLPLLHFSRIDEWLEVERYLPVASKTSDCKRCYKVIFRRGIIANILQKGSKFRQYGQVEALEAFSGRNRILVCSMNDYVY